MFKQEKPFPSFIGIHSIAEQFHYSIFSSYVRPRINPLLSKFCKELTGIEQSQVDKAPYFPVVFKLFTQWLVEHKLLSKLIGNPEKVRIDENVPSWTFVTGKFLFFLAFNLGSSCSFSFKNKN